MRTAIKIKEDKVTLQKLKSQSGSHLHPRIKMLLALLAESTTTNAELAAATGASLRSIARWVKNYTTGGLDALLAEGRGGDHRSGISEEKKKQLANKLSDPKSGFRSYGEAKAWAEKELGIEKEYHAFNKYLKRNFNTKLKVGRKSHVKKDDAAIAVFKKPTRED